MLRALAAVGALALAAEAQASKVGLANKHFVLPDGRVAIFHGLNAVYKLAPWMPDASGAFSPTSSLNAEDMANLHSWGFNVLRMSVMWDGAWLPGVGWNMTYLAAFRSLVDSLGQAGIYVLLDMHQDDLSRPYCGEGIPVEIARGAPLNASWLQFPFPLPANLTLGPDGFPNITQCLQWPFIAFMFAYETQANVGSLYSNASAIAAFSSYWATVAGAFSNASNVIGLELINEPWPADIYAHPLDALLPGIADTKWLLPLYNNLSAAIRSVDSETLIFYEPAVTEPMLGQQSGFTAPPLNDNRTVYAYHLYCQGQDAAGDIMNLTACQDTLTGFWTNELASMSRLPSGSFMTEFGAVGQDASSAGSLTFLTDLVDTQLQSWAYWSYKYFDDITTQNQASETLYDAQGALQPLKLAALTRSYAQYIAAVPSLPIAMRFDAASGNFSLSYTANAALPAASQQTLVYFNEALHYAGGWAASVSPPAAATVSQPEPNYLLIQHAQGYGGLISFSLQPAAAAQPQQQQRVAA